MEGDVNDGQNKTRRLTRVSFLLPAAARGGGEAFLSCFLDCCSLGGTTLSSLGLEGVSAFDGVGDVSGFGALVSAFGVGTSGGGGTCSSFLG